MAPSESSLYGGISSCLKCDRMKKQAEDAFRELRTQADLHISTIQRKLETEYESELTRLNKTIDKLRLDNDKLANSRLRDNETRAEIDAVSTEYQGRISQMESELLAVEKESENQLRASKRDIRNLQVHVASLEETHAQLVQESSLQNEEISRLKAENEKLQHELEAAKAQNAQMKSKAIVYETGKQEWSLEKAKIDLAYRKRIGEMESEVRRTEIESVRLRKEIFSLKQQLEAGNSLTSYDGGLHERFRSLIDSHSEAASVRKSMIGIFAYEETTRPSGRIARVTPECLPDLE